MIHSIHTMTVGRYIKLDKTGDDKLLRRWFNPFPVKWFDDSIQRFFDDVREVFDADDASNSLYERGEQLYMVNKILKMSILYDALYAIMVTHTQLKLMLLSLDKPAKKIENFEYFKQQVKELTGITIEKVSDLIRLKKEIDRTTDKFKERWPDGDVSDEKTSFAEVALSVFSLMEMPYNERMTLYEYGALKNLADKKVKHLEKLKAKRGAA